MDTQYGDESLDANPYQNRYKENEAKPMDVRDEKTWAVLVHVLSLIGSFFFVGFLPAFVIYLTTKSRGPFVRHHAAQELNFQLTMILSALALGALWVAGIVVWVLLAILWIPTAILWVVGVVIPIIGAVNAGNGEFYKLPLSIPFIR
jgi:uncharacterized Tic20 family protein